MSPRYKKLSISPKFEKIIGITLNVVIVVILLLFTSVLYITSSTYISRSNTEQITRGVRNELQYARDSIQSYKSNDSIYMDSSKHDHSHNVVILDTVYNTISMHVHHKVMRVLYNQMDNGNFNIKDGTMSVIGNVNHIIIASDSLRQL